MVGMYYGKDTNHAKGGIGMVGMYWRSFRPPVVECAALLGNFAARQALDHLARSLEGPLAEGNPVLGGILAQADPAPGLLRGRELPEPLIHGRGTGLDERIGNAGSAGLLMRDNRPADVALVEGKLDRQSQVLGSPLDSAQDVNRIPRPHTLNKIGRVQACQKRPAAPQSGSQFPDGVLGGDRKSV